MYRISCGIALLLLVFASAPARAQTPSGELSGIVSDTSGLPVPGVTVTLTNQATHQGPTMRQHLA